ncbi:MULTISPECIES: hypothetical protein [unclassified Acinetobacter]|uniref:hypothetical protein n=1 Tax=unclassified Acinetobacter TaxID=196816 RepID=UPI001250B09C|nr:MULTISPECIES: hypothetical protein [unclassified Acinetobacter]
MRMTEEQYQNMRLNAKKQGLQPNKSKSDTRALGRLKQGVMNQTERKYANLLESKKMTGEIIYYAFDSIKFRLADKTFYSPDFIVMKSGELEAHEVKGHWEDDARVKIKVAASLHPIPFIAVKRNEKNNSWEYEHF